MNSSFKVIAVCSLLSIVSLALAQRNKGVTSEDVLAAMRKSTDYLANEVSLNGGYLHMYAEDFSEQYGEGKKKTGHILQRQRPWKNRPGPKNCRLKKKYFCAGTPFYPFIIPLFSQRLLSIIYLNV